MSRLFLSYRRVDSRLVTNRIYDRLVAKFGKEDVFKDVDNIPPGRDFRGVLREATSECEVMLVVIGPNWVSAADASGNRRLDDANDFVRIEVETGLQRDGIVVIPLLVEGASMPRPDQLPEFIRELSFNNAFTIHDDPLFHHDMDTLIGSLRGGAPSKRAFPWRIALAGLLVVIVGLVALPPLLSQLFPTPSSPTPSLETSTTLPVTPTLSFTDTPSPTSTPLAFTENEIGVVVSYFVTPPEQDIPEDKAEALIDGVYNRIAMELDDFADRLDLPIVILPPSRARHVTGRTRADRERSARELATSLQADVILYGEITRDSVNRARLIMSPEFYVSPDQFIEALELTGSFRLGGEIGINEVALDSIEAELTANSALGGRTTSAALIFAGLVFYVTGEYDLARITFEQAVQQTGWENTDGREVLFVLRGNVYTKLASVAAQNRDTSEAHEQLELARAQYEAAIAPGVAPEYARAYVGLASVDYLEWNIDLQETGISNRDILNQALEQLQDGAQAFDQPNELAVRMKRIFAQAQVNFALWTNHGTQMETEEADVIYDRFQTAAQVVIQNYGEGSNPALQELASESHALVGLAGLTQGECTTQPRSTSLDHFLTAIELALLDQRQMFFYGWLGYCYAARGENDIARESFREARRLALSLDPPPQTQINLYNCKIAQPQDTCAADPTPQATSEAQGRG